MQKGKASLVGPPTGLPLSSTPTARPLPGLTGLARPAAEPPNQMEASLPPLILHAACMMAFLKHRSDCVTRCFKPQKAPQRLQNRTSPWHMRSFHGLTYLPRPHLTPLPVTHLPPPTPNASTSPCLYKYYFLVGRPFPFSPTWQTLVYPSLTSSGRVNSFPPGCSQNILII